MNQTPTKRLRGFKHDTLVRKVRSLERMLGASAATITRKRMTIEELEGRIGALKIEKASFVRRIEQLGEQHGRALHTLEIERDEWRSLAFQEAKRRLDGQHDLRVSNRRWQDEEAPPAHE